MNSQTQSKRLYTATGMTCQGCVQKLNSSLNSNPEILNASVNLDPPEVSIEFVGNPLTLEKLNDSIDQKYRLSELSEYTASQLSSIGDKEIVTVNETNSPGPPAVNESRSGSDTTEAASFIKTYWPLLLVAMFIVGGTCIVLSASARWEVGFAMRVFMGLFFVVFSFFKFLDLSGFATAYQGYDWVAQRIPGYGYVYPFIELALGCCYLLNAIPHLINWLTLVVMTVSICGVIDSVLNKRKIKCACLGTGFNLPMSQVTIIEDGLMIGMAAAMIVASFAF